MTWFQRHPLLASCLAGLVAGVLAAGVWSWLRPDASGAEAEAAATSTTTSAADPTSSTRSGPPAAEAEIDALVGDLLEFVAETRGLEPLDPVEVELQDDEVFLAGLLDDLEEDEDLAGVGATLRALKLVPQNFDLEEELRGTLESGVVGYYDPETDLLYVRGTSLTPFVEVTLVHELVHALQDQHFGLEALLDIEDDEAFSGAQALVEGDAELVASDYLFTLSFEEQAQLLAEAESFLGPGSESSGGVDVLDAVLGFPYIHGPEFVAALVEGQGYDRVDAAFDDPPRSTEQILHPEAYLFGEDPLEVELPDAEGEVVDDGSIGEFLLGYLLDPSGGDEDALEAAEGWGGDAYVTWRENGRIVTAVRFVMDGATDREELLDALRAWAREHGRARVAESGRDLVLEASVADVEQAASEAEEPPARRAA